MKTQSLIQKACLVMGSCLMVLAFEISAAEPAGTNTTTSGMVQGAEPGVAQNDEDPLIVQIMGISVGFVAVVLGCGIPLLAIWTDYRKKHELLQICHQERVAALEKGLEPPSFPAELFQGEDGFRGDGPPATGLKSGLVWLGIGAGVAIWLGVQAEPKFHPGFSAIPLGLGVAYFLYYFLEGRKHAQIGPKNSPGR